MNKIKSTTSDKAKIREEVKRRISLLSQEEKNKASQSVCEKLLSSETFQKAENIIIYETLEDEVDLSGLATELHIQKKNIYTIDISGKHTELPSEGVILVPGRAFTLSGKRIGRGGGWYDNFLAQHPHYRTIGVCFECQVFDDIPQDIWDIPLDAIIYSSIQSGQ